MKNIKTQVEKQLNEETQNDNWVKYLKFRKKMKTFEDNNKSNELCRQFKREQK